DTIAPTTRDTFSQTHIPYSPTNTSPSPTHISFFFTDTATTQIYTLSLHDALPISPHAVLRDVLEILPVDQDAAPRHVVEAEQQRSEEHTSELQSRSDLVCRLLLEKKKKTLRSYTRASPDSDGLSLSRTLHYHTSFS